MLLLKSANKLNHGLVFHLQTHRAIFAKSIIFENVININCGIESYSCQTLLKNKENKEK